MSEEKESENKNEERENNEQIKIDNQQIKSDNQHLNRENFNSESLDTIQQLKNDNNDFEKQEKITKDNSESQDVIQQIKTDQSDYSNHEKHNDNSEFSNTVQQFKTSQLDHEKQRKNDNIEVPKKIQQIKTNCDTHHQEDEENSEKSSKFKPIKNLKFCGMRDPVHPALFIENFEQYAAKEHLDEDEKQNHFVNSLRKYAAIWLDERGHSTYEEMKDAFLSFYWSSDIQDSFTKYLDTGKYTRKCRLSMANYFFKHAIGAKFLDSSPSEQEIIDKLIKHFDKHIGDEILIQKAQTIEEVIDILKRIDILKGTNKSTDLSTKIKMSIVSSNKKNSLNSWGWLFLLLAVTSIGLSFFSKIFMTK